LPNYAKGEKISYYRKAVASKFLSKIAYKKACPNEQAFIIHV